MDEWQYKSIVTAIIMAGATVMAYFIGEGLVDATSAGNTRPSYRITQLAPLAPYRTPELLMQTVPARRRQ